MTASWMRWAACFVCFLAGSSIATGQTVKKLYLEPFGLKDSSGRLQPDFIAEIRKLKSVLIVSNQSDADLILTGEGEVWVKGYTSLNPRSGRSPANGTPVYAGFLSVELKDAKGETLWSYLLTPNAASEDIAKGLSVQMTKRLAEALLQPLVPGAKQPDNATAAVTHLQGAGATFPEPIYTKWFAGYRRQRPNVEIAYEPVGSEAGVRKLLAGGADFAASDSPEILHALAPDNPQKYLLFPSVAGAVVPIVNLPGFTGNLSFTPESLAGIYLGKIKKWNDPILKQANPGVALPDLDIVVVHRSDGSGTTYTWTDYLTKTSLDWKAAIGTGLTANWPVGRPAAGNDGVAKLVKELGGSIGYVEFIYALRNRLNFAKVRNRHGESVNATLESVTAATTDSLGTDLRGSITDSPEARAYPIASFTWFVVPSRIANSAKREALMSFLRWMIGPGQQQAAALGYVALPKSLLAREDALIASIQ